MRLLHRIVRVNQHRCVFSKKRYFKAARHFLIFDLGTSAFLYIFSNNNDNNILQLLLLVLLLIHKGIKVAELAFILHKVFSTLRQLA